MQKLLASIILGVLILITKGSLQSLFQIQFSMGDLLMLIACLFLCELHFILVKPKERILFSILFWEFFPFPFYVSHLYYKKDSTTIFC
jgi:drug/metabolite transporter (DMT)-like permease